MGIYWAVRDGFKKAKTRFLLGCVFDIISGFILIYIVTLTGTIVDLFKSPNFDVTKIYKYVALMIFLGVINFLSFMTFSYLVFGSGAKIKMYYKDIIFCFIINVVIIKNVTIFRNTMGTQVRIRLQCTHEYAGVYVPIPRLPIKLFIIPQYNSPIILFFRLMIFCTVLIFSMDIVRPRPFKVIPETHHSQLFRPFVKLPHSCFP